MLTKLKKFFCNPLYLLGAVISVAVLTVGSLLAFNALAADDEINEYYKPCITEHLYYNGTTENVYAQTYYQDIVDVTETWKAVSITSSGGSNVNGTFLIDGEDDIFSPNPSTHFYLKLTAETPDQNSSGWNKKVWVYKCLYQRTNGGYHVYCVGSTTVGALLEDMSGANQLCSYDSYDCNYTQNSKPISSVTLDESEADDTTGVDLSSGGYAYSISETKPYSYSGGSGYSLPSGLYSGSVAPDLLLFYEADPDIEYTAEYQKTVDVPYRKYLLKKSTAADFAFGSNITIPIKKSDVSAPVATAKIDIVDNGGNVIYTADFSYAYVDTNYAYNTYLNCGYSDYMELEKWLVNPTNGDTGSCGVSVPLSITIKYDYSHYKSRDGHNMQNADLDGTSEVYKTNLDDIGNQSSSSVLGDLGYQYFTFADADQAPLFRPKEAEADVWCETEFWRNKGDTSSRYELGQSLEMYNIISQFGQGDSLKSKFKFNNSTGYWDYTMRVEPIFENCYLTLTYHDGYIVYEDWGDEFYYNYYISYQIHPYIYKDDSGELLSEPVQPSVEVSSPKNLTWRDEYSGYSTTYDYLLENHTGQRFVDWTTEYDNKGTHYAVDDVLQMNGNMDIYAQWNDLVYHIVYDYHSPTGDDNDIVVKGNYYDNGDYIEDVDITDIFPKVITFSRDTSKDDPSWLNLYSNYFSYAYSSYDITSYSGLDIYYYDISLGVSDSATVPDGTAFQYWSLTNSAEATNDQVYDISINDFKQADDGDYYVTLHAIWTQPTYKLVYNENKREDSDTVSNMPKQTTVTVRYSELMSGYALSSVVPTYSPKTLTFDGWSLNAEGTSKKDTIYYSNFDPALEDGATINVYAVWLSASSVTYYSNVSENDMIQPTGTVPVDTSKYSSTQYATVQANTGNLARVGYVFSGWNTESDGSGTAYTGGQTILMQDNVKLYAQWTPLRYKLHYDENAKLTAVENMPATPVEIDITSFTKSDDDKYIYTLAPSATPSALGYDFKGWGKIALAEVNPDAGVDQSVKTLALSDFKEVTDESTGEKTYEFTVYAIWNPISYKLNYNENKKTGMGDVTGLPNARTLTISNFTKQDDGQYTYNLNDIMTAEGFTFIGWNTSETASAKLDSVNLSSDFDTDSNTCDVYAIWEENTYSLVYQKGDGHDSATIPADVTGLTYTDVKNGYELSSEVPTHTGYDFVGWEVSDVTDKLDEGDTVPFASFNNTQRTATATATWLIKSFPVEYYDENGTKIADYGQIFEYNTADCAVRPISDIPIVEGKTIQGWKLMSDSTSVAINDGKFTMPAGTVKFQAAYTEDIYSIIYQKGDGHDSATIPAGNTDLRYADVKNGYVLSADVPADTGYDFAGWQVNDVADKLNAGGTVPVTAFSNDAKTATATATWTIKSFPVEYYDENGTKIAGYDQAFEYNTANCAVRPISDIPAVAGKTAQSWALMTDSASVAINDGKFTMPAGTVKFQATYTENIYGIIYQKGDGHDSATIPVGNTDLRYADIKDGYVLSADVPTDTGYTFAGWQINDVADKLNAGGTVPVAAFNNDSKTVTATATWTINSYDVIYCEADGTLIGAAQQYEYMSDVTVGQNAGTPKTFADKTWTGKWEVFDSPSTDGDNQAIGNTGTTFKMPANAVKFKAVYEDNVYTVRYTAGYADSGQADLTESVNHGETRTVKAHNTFTRTGWHMTGWTVAPDTYSVTPGEEITITSNITYTANWEIDQFTVIYQDGYSTNTQIFTLDYNQSHTVQEYTMFSRTGYNLTGWQLVEPNGGTYSVTPGASFNVTENVTYKALWTTKEYPVIYQIDVPDDISYTVPAQTNKPYGSTVTVEPAPTGFDTNKYEFSGWSSGDADISSGSFNMPAKTVLITGSFNLKDQITLTYHANGATGTVHSPVSDYSSVTETIKGKGNLQKTGYSFDGWTSNQDGTGVAYAEGATCTFDVNTIIYAKWVPVEYHVRYYDINGNELTSLAEAHDYSTDFTVRSTADIPNNVTGKSPAGWTLMSSGEQNAADGTAIRGSGTYQMPAGDVKFQASYDDIYYTVTYQVSNPPSTYTRPETNSYKYQESVPVADIPDIEGYNFTGWNCSAVDVSSGSFTMPAENVFITGSFSEKGKVTLTYNANGGTPETAVPVSEWAYTELNTTIKNHTGLTKKGYKFEGWNTKADGSGTDYAVSSVTTHKFTASTVLYAKWGKDSFDVKYYEKDGTTPITTHRYEYQASVNVGSGVTAASVEGYDFSGWVLINNAQKDADGADIGTRTGYPMPAETVQYKAAYMPKKYTVTYRFEGDIPAGHSVPVQVTYNYGETVNVKPVESEEGYTFSGWDYNGSGTLYAESTAKASFVIKENVVLTGVWTKEAPDPNKMTITYTSGLKDADITDPSLSMTYTEQVTLGNDYTVHGNDWTNYKRPGYKFVNWKVAAPEITGFSLIDQLAARFIGPATVGQVFSAGDTITALSENIRLEAQWEAETYSVIYHSNGATGGTVPTDDKDYSYKETAEVKGQGDLVKDGATFLYWSTNSNGNGKKYYEGDTIEMTGNVDLYGIWSAEPSDETYYTLKYHANGATGGTVPLDNTRYAGGEEATVADKGNLVRDGYTFKEWNTQANGKGTGYKADDVFTMPESDVTLYAIWVDSQGNIASPGTGENAFHIQLAVITLILSLILSIGLITTILVRNRKAER